MVTNGGNTEGLFRAAFMSSGSPVPVGNITHGQKYYDALVNDTGCFGTADTLECLRQVPYEKLKAAVDKSPNLSSTQVCDYVLDQFEGVVSIYLLYRELIYHGFLERTGYSSLRHRSI